MANAVRSDAALSIPAVAATSYCSGAQRSALPIFTQGISITARIKNQEYWPIPVITENLFLSCISIVLSYSKVL